MFARWFQSGLISQPTVFFSHNKPTPTKLISPETAGEQSLYIITVGTHLGPTQAESERCS